MWSQSRASRDFKVSGPKALTAFTRGESWAVLPAGAKAIEQECRGDKVCLMAEGTNSESFEEIVEWAYSTLPQKIRDLPDFPGIQVHARWC